MISKICVVCSVSYMYTVVGRTWMTIYCLLDFGGKLWCPIIASLSFDEIVIVCKKQIKMLITDYVLEPTYRNFSWKVYSCELLFLLSKNNIQSIQLMSHVHKHINIYIYIYIVDLEMYSGPQFNIKITSFRYWKSHCGDKPILRPYYLHNRISYTDKMTSFYWSRA